MKQLTAYFLVCFLFVQIVTAQDLRVYPFRFIQVEKSDSDPIIDGIIHPGEWRGQAHGSFVQTNGNTGQPAAYQTTFFINHNDRFLFLAVECYDPEPSSLVTEALRFDDESIFFDDRIELFFDVNHDHRTYYHLVINPEGVQYDRKVLHWLPLTRTHHGYPDWHGFWYGATNVHEKGWTAEIAIELSALGIDNLSDGETWGFNIGRVRQPAEKPEDDIRNISPAPGTEYSAWNPVRDALWQTPSNFYEPMLFGDIVFQDPGFEIDQIAFPNMSYGLGSRGKPSVFGENPFIINISEYKNHEIMTEVNVYRPKEGGIFTEQGKMVKKYTDASLKKPENNLLNLNYRIRHDQENLVEVTLSDPNSGKKLYQTSYMVNTPPFIEFDLETLYTGKVDFSKPVGYRLRTSNIDPDLYYLELSFLDKEHRKIESTTIREIPLSTDYQDVFNTEKLRALPGDNYYIDCRLVNKNDNSVEGHFIQALTKFSTNRNQKFGAVRDIYSYGGVSGEAVILTFPFNARFVFWDKASFIPWWDIDQAVMSNEFVETWGMGTEGCAEPMQDRETRYSKVSILENSEARIRVRWRYALADAHYYIHANEWVEEYYTFYPDGTGVREIHLYANTEKSHEIFEAIYVNPPHVTTFQLYEDEITSLKNLDGEKYGIRELESKPDFYKQFVSENTDIILETHFKNRINPFSVFAMNNNLIPYHEELLDFKVTNRLASDDTKRGHWPDARYPIDGFNTVGNDVSGHFSLGNIHVMSNPNKMPNKWYMLTGIKEDDSKTDILATKSWVYPTLPNRVTGAVTSGLYDSSQRAYIHKYSGKGSRARLEFNGLIYNPAFIFEGMPFNEIKRIKIDGKVLSGRRYATGKTENDELVLFIEHTDEQSSRIDIEFN